MCIFQQSPCLAGRLLWGSPELASVISKDSYRGMLPGAWIALNCCLRETGYVCFPGLVGASSKWRPGGCVTSCNAQGSPRSKELSSLVMLLPVLQLGKPGEMSPARVSSLTHTPGLWSSSFQGWQSRQQCRFTPHSHTRLEIFNPLFCALSWKWGGHCHQEEFLEQSISQSASTYWNICYVPCTY